jgi:CheY-like chemotaxis protein
MSRVLIVEDNKLNQLVALRLVEREGHQTEVVSSGSDALVRLSVSHFDAILMDCQMPGMDGYEATHAIRASEARGTEPPTPIIGLSASAMKGDREAAIDAGMDDYLTKPVQVEELRAVLHRWIDG